MKAAQVSKYGGSEVVSVVEVPEPDLKAEQLLVEVYAASINPFDGKLRSGMYKETIPIQVPYIPGADFAGVVRKIGQGVQDFGVGDAVYGHAIVLIGGSGAFAESTAVNTANAAKKPQSIDFIAAASLPLVGSSAIQALEEHMNLTKGQKILIHGGAGGIGSIAIQIAKNIGAYVATTVSSDDFEHVRGLGADKTIDYKHETFETMLSEYDAVFDTIGGSVMEKSFNVLKKGGVLVSMVGQPSEQAAAARGIKAIAQQTQTNASHLTRLAQLVDSGVVKAQVDKVYPLSAVREAFDRLEKGSPRGKVVLQMRQ
jgi:alcohol dehydrogenase